MCIKNLKNIRRFVIIIGILFFQNGILFGQEPVELQTNTQEYIFNSDKVFFVEDSSATKTFADISASSNAEAFKANQNYYPKNLNRSSTYWFRIKLKFDENTNGNSLIEFFDQTADLVEAYMPDGKGGFEHYKSGASLDFDHRYFRHKNFEFPISSLEKGTYEAYFKVHSRQMVNVIFVYRSIERFVQYALAEYFTFGLFYGMILLFGFHNLLMYFAVRGRQYLYYVLYVFCFGLYEMSSDGIAFQYLWPSYPWFNQYAIAFFVCCVSVFALLFTKSLLQVKQREPKLNHILNVVIVLRILFFVYCLCFQQTWFIFKFVEVIPLSLAFFTGIWLWRKKYRPARYFVLGYSFLFLSFIVKVVYVLGYARFIHNYIGHYSITFGVFIEMIFLSFAIGDRVRLLKNKKERAQGRVIEQMRINEKLQESYNKELKQEVEDRTLEIVQKSKRLAEKSEIIANQNQELTEMNKLLMEQTEEINRMNQLLTNDNKTLQTNIERITDDRVLSKEMEFEEFQLKYDDKETCYKLLSDLKWSAGYSCIKCGYDNYCAGKTPYSRRCTKCTYEESVLNRTIFENVRIPINKAFYIVYLVHFYQGDISSYKLSQKVGIRQSTCWNYASRVKTLLSGTKKSKKSSWTTLILNTLD